MNKHHLSGASRLLIVLSAAVMTVAGGCDNEATREEKLVCDKGTMCGGVCCEYDCNDGQCVFPGENPAASENDCKNGQSFCAGKCVSFSSDPMHCGDCDTKCSPGESCQAGSCVVGCPDGLTLVDNALCVNPDSDIEHCGAGNVACGDNMYCNTGACECQAGYYDCDGDAANGCESNVICELACEAGKQSCGAGVCCLESESCCGSSCCAEGTTCCGDGACLDLKTDVKHCGGCSISCDADQVCEDGACVKNSLTCDDGQKACWGACIDVMIDSNNCGGCDIVCDDGKVCSEGTCSLSCAEGQIVCDEKCVDPATDNLNCGECGNECRPEEMCTVVTVTEVNDAGEEVSVQKNACEVTTSIPGKEEFTCACAGDDENCVPKTACWGSCFDLQSDVNNCGECGNVCEEGLSCVEGACTLVCADDLTACGKECINTQTDHANCGDCGSACETTQICSAGECVDATISCEAEAVNKTLCWGVCVDTSSENNNCGECGHVCDDGLVCYDGTCIEKIEGSDCPPGQTMCFGACKDLHKDVDNCGACLNACGDKYICSDSKCEMVCGENELKCGEVCIDPLTSTKNCGACGNVCQSGQECRAVDAEDGTKSAACQCDANHFDCDGDPSNGCESTTACACKPKSTQPCWRGTPETRGVGACKDGVQTCDASGMFWGACKGGTYPSATTCNDAGLYIGGDQNCNGIPDNQEACKSSCDLMAGSMSYIGCEYWAVYTENEVATNHTVVFSNPSSTDTATISIFNYQGYSQTTPSPLKTITLAPNQVTFHTLTTGTTNMNSNSGINTSAYRIRSSTPITAYQFNPWSAAEAHSNDASLMLPQNVLANTYRVLNWHVVPYAGGGSEFASNVTVVATEPGTTTVKVVTTAPIKSGTGVSDLSKGQSATYTLNQFQVLNLKSSTSSADQTGSLITSDKKVAVYSGTRCSFIPDNDWACDHLEEQLFPVSTWGKSYYAVRSYPRGNAGDFWKILAHEDGTVVTLPASLGGTVTLNAGEFRKFETTASFEVKANKAISVGQFLTGKDHNNAGTGDPAFVLAVPYEQYRSDYAFLVPSTYSSNYVAIVKPVGSVVKLDGNIVNVKFTTIDNTSYEYGYVSVTPGTHHMTGDAGFGLTGYGFLGYTSYGYPIGLDLKVLNTN